MRRGWLWMVGLLLLAGCETKLVLPEGSDDEPPMTTDLVLSEVRVTSSSEGGFRNTYVEIYNGTGTEVDLSDY
ncbi:MAG: hypothetical protein AAGA85_08395, partial [Bacteroidota bacterium]